MSCCGNHNHGTEPDQLQDGQAARRIKHRPWLMIICCLLPIVLAALFFLIPSVTGSGSNMVPALILLICPLSHLVLMPLVMKKRNSRHS